MTVQPSNGEGPEEGFSALNMFRMPLPFLLHQSKRMSLPYIPCIVCMKMHKHR